MWRRIPTGGYSLALVLVGLSLGLLLQVGVHTPPGTGGESDYERARVRAAIDRLDQEQLDLKEAIGGLRQRLKRYQELDASRTEMLQELTKELAAQRMRAGLVALQGPGVVVTLDDSDMAVDSPDADLDRYIVHEYDVRDVVNLLWIAGAEGVALNDERIVASTSVYCVGSTIMVNDTRVSPPYLVRAIGDPAALYAAAMDPAHLEEFRQRAQQHGLRLTVDWRKAVVVPAYRGGFAFDHAQAGSS